MDDYVSFGSSRIDYRINRKSRKTLGISVLPNGEVEVVAPENATIEEIRKIVAIKGSWIISQKNELRTYPVKQPCRKIITGETVRYLGKQFRIQLLRSEENEVYILDDKIHIETKDPYGFELNKKLLLNWYKSQALDVFKVCFERCIQRSEKIGLKATVDFTIRKMNKRWGSCLSEGKILLNLELICTPIDCIEYVILHELCHLIEPSHNQRFFDILASVCPDYKFKKKRLEMNSEGLMGL